MDIGKLIREERLKRGLSQEGLARKTDLSLSSIRRYEKGEREITIEVAGQLSDALGIELAEFLGIKPVEQKQESRIEALFNELNEEGQEKVIEYIRMLKLGGYIKSSEYGQMEA